MTQQKQKYTGSVIGKILSHTLAYLNHKTTLTTDNILVIIYILFMKKINVYFFSHRMSNYVVLKTGPRLMILHPIIPPLLHRQPTC